MANIQLQQTDTAAVDGAMAACSALASSQTPDNKQASSGGSPGTTTPQISLFGSDNGSRGIHFESATNEPGQTSWPAGNWVVRLNVTTANTNIQWISTHICRVTSNGVNQSTVGSLTGQSISLGSTGVQSMTISGSSQLAQAGDRIYIVLGFKNINVAPQAFNYQPNQLIDTPITSLPLFIFTKKSKRPRQQVKKKRRLDFSWMYHPLRSPPLWPFSPGRPTKKNFKPKPRKWQPKSKGVVHLISAFHKLCGHGLVEERLLGTARIAETMASLAGKTKATATSLMPSLSTTSVLVESIGKTGSNLGVKGTSAKVAEALSATATLECCK
jgi:hypothetical protein